MNRKLYPLYRGYVEILHTEGASGYERLFSESTEALEPNLEVLAVLVALMDFHLKRPLLTSTEFEKTLAMLTRGNPPVTW